MENTNWSLIMKKIMREMEELGKKGFMLGDSVMLTEATFSAIEENKDDEFMESFYKKKLYITDINDNIVTVKSEDTHIELKFRADSVDDHIILVYRMDSGIPIAEKYSRDNQGV